MRTNGYGRRERARRAGVVVATVASLAVLSACTSSSDSATSTTAASPAAGSSAGSSSSGATTSGATDPTAAGVGPTSAAPIGVLPADAQAIMDKPAYKTARWNYYVADAETGEVLMANRPDEMVLTASTAKNFTVGSVYGVLGPDTTLTTPVYVTTPAAGGVVAGDLVLVASGDLALGGRNAAQGKFDNSFTATTIDHVYGDVGAPNAAVAPGNPLAGLDDLAAQVAATGITQIDGNVTIDTRSWETYVGQEGLVPSIFVNDNLLDITVTGTTVGQPATVASSPQTAAFTVTSTVTTTDAETPGGLKVVADPDNPTAITVSGTVGAGASQLTVYRIPDAASWARTLFIEALTRAGVTVAAPAVALNSEAALPAVGSYPADQQVASLTSPPLSAMGGMILETSYNTGANAMLCLLAVNAGSTNCEDGLKVIREQIDKAGLVTEDVVLLDGQGKDPASVTPTQISNWMAWTRTQPWGDVLTAGLPIYGETGSLASVGQNSPAKGKIVAKTGTSAAFDPGTGRMYWGVQNLAGYMTTDQGRELVFGLYMSGGSYPDPSTGLSESGPDIAGVADAFQRALSGA